MPYLYQVPNGYQIEIEYLARVKYLLSSLIFTFSFDTNIFEEINTQNGNLFVYRGCKILLKFNENLLNQSGYQKL